jgi:ABC-type ATPase involved in cell division
MTPVNFHLNLLTTPNRRSQAKTDCRIDHNRANSQRYKFMNEVLRLEKICFRYSANHPLIDNLSIGLRSGEYKAAANEPGLDESLLLKLIIGELKPSSGSGTLLGYPIFRLSARRKRQLLRQIGIIPRTELVSDETLCHFVALPLQIAGIRSSRVVQKVRSSLAELNLTLLAHQPLNTLTSDQRRLASLAQALIKTPKLVLFDSRRDQFDSMVIEPLLRKYSLYGGAVLEFTPQQEGTTVLSSGRDERAGAYAPA